MSKRNEREDDELAIWVAERYVTTLVLSKFCIASPKAGVPETGERQVAREGAKGRRKSRTGRHWIVF
jgi:hypothetical protein